MFNVHRIFIDWVLISTLLWYQLISCQEQPHSQLRFRNVANCDIKGLKMLIDKFSTQYYFPRNYLNARYRVVEDINTLKSVYLHVERRNDQGYDCEDFQNLKIEQSCRMISLKNQIWSDFVTHFYPPLRCPLKKATYDVQNATADTDMLLRWYPDLSKYHWKVLCKITNEYDSLIACVIVEAYVHQLIKQDRKPPRRPKSNNHGSSQKRIQHYHSSQSFKIKPSYS